MRRRGHNPPFLPFLIPSGASPIASYRTEWVGNTPRDLVSGLLVVPALILEAISFAVIAGGRRAQA